MKIKVRKILRQKIRFFSPDITISFLQCFICSTLFLLPSLFKKKNFFVTENYSRQELDTFLPFSKLSCELIYGSEIKYILIFLRKDDMLHRS